MVDSIDFQGLTAFRSEFPNVEVETSSGLFDLHNAADLDGLEVDLAAGELMVRWTVKPEAWRRDDKRSAVARLVLVCGGVREISGSGRIELAGEDGRVLDYIEYVRGPDPRLVFSWVGGFSLEVGCSSCEARVMA